MVKNAVRYILLSLVAAASLWLLAQRNRVPDKPVAITISRPDAVTLAANREKQYNWAKAFDDDRERQRPYVKPDEYKTSLVVASRRGEQTAWIADAAFDKWQRFVYSIDDRDAPLSVPSTNGREAMVYLT